MFGLSCHRTISGSSSPVTATTKKGNPVIHYLDETDGDFMPTVMNLPRTEAPTVFFHDRQYLMMHSGGEIIIYTKLKGEEERLAFPVRIFENGVLLNPVPSISVFSNRSHQDKDKKEVHTAFLTKDGYLGRLRVYLSKITMDQRTEKSTALSATLVTKETVKQLHLQLDPLNVAQSDALRAVTLGASRKARNPRTFQLRFYENITVDGKATATLSLRKLTDPAHLEISLGGWYVAICYRDGITFGQLARIFGLNNPLPLDFSRVSNSSPEWNTVTTDNPLVREAWKKSPAGRNSKSKELFFKSSCFGGGRVGHPRYLYVVAECQNGTNESAILQINICQFSAENGGKVSVTALDISGLNKGKDGSVPQIFHNSLFYLHTSDKKTSVHCTKADEELYGTVPKCEDFDRLALHPLTGDLPVSKHDPDAAKEDHPWHTQDVLYLFREAMLYPHNLVSKSRYKHLLSFLVERMQMHIQIRKQETVDTFRRRVTGQTKGEKDIERHKTSLLKLTGHLPVETSILSETLFDLAAQTSDKDFHSMLINLVGNVEKPLYPGYFRLDLKNWILTDCRKEPNQLQLQRDDTKYATDEESKNSSDDVCTNDRDEKKDSRAGSTEGIDENSSGSSHPRSKTTDSSSNSDDESDGFDQRIIHLAKTDLAYLRKLIETEKLDVEWDYQKDIIMHVPKRFNTGLFSEKCEPNLKEFKKAPVQFPVCVPSNAIDSCFRVHTWMKTNWFYDCIRGRNLVAGHDFAIVLFIRDQKLNDYKKKVGLEMCAFVSLPFDHKQIAIEIYREIIRLWGKYLKFEWVFQIDDNVATLYRMPSNGGARPILLTPDENAPASARQPPDERGGGLEICRALSVYALGPNIDKKVGVLGLVRMKMPIPNEMPPITWTKSHAHCFICLNIPETDNKGIRYRRKNEKVDICKDRIPTMDKYKQSGPLEDYVFNWNCFDKELDVRRNERYIFRKIERKGPSAKKGMKKSTKTTAAPKA